MEALVLLSSVGRIQVFVIHPSHYIGLFEEKLVSQLHCCHQHLQADLVHMHGIWHGAAEHDRRCGKGLQFDLLIGLTAGDVSGLLERWEPLPQAGGQGEHRGAQEHLCCWLPMYRLNFSLELNIFLLLLLE